jgi:hypothetical protein
MKKAGLYRESVALFTNKKEGETDIHYRIEVWRRENRLLQKLER